MIHSKLFRDSPFEFNFNGDQVNLLDYCDNPQVLYSVLDGKPFVEIFADSPVVLPDTVKTKYLAYLRSINFSGEKADKHLLSLTSPREYTAYVEYDKTVIETVDAPTTTLYDVRVNARFRSIEIPSLSLSITNRSGKLSITSPALTHTERDRFGDKVTRPGIKMPSLSSVPVATSATSVVLISDEGNGYCSAEFRAPPLGFRGFGTIYPDVDSSYKPTNWAYIPVNDTILDKLMKSIADSMGDQRFIDLNAVREWFVEKRVHVDAIQMLPPPAEDTRLLAGLSPEGFWLTYNQGVLSQRVTMSRLRSSIVAGATGVRGDIIKLQANLSRATVEKVASMGGEPLTPEQDAAAPPGYISYAWFTEGVIVPKGIVKETKSYKKCKKLGCDMLPEATGFDGITFKHVDRETYKMVPVNEISWFVQDNPTLSQLSPDLYNIDTTNGRLCATLYSGEDKPFPDMNLRFNIVSDDNWDIMTSNLSKEEVVFAWLSNMPMTHRNQAGTEEEKSQIVDALLCHQFGVTSRDDVLQDEMIVDGVNVEDILANDENEFSLDSIMTGSYIDLAEWSPADQPGTSCTILAMRLATPDTMNIASLVGSVYGTFVALDQHYLPALSD